MKQWVAIYEPDDLKGKKETLDAHHVVEWIYTGCNNKSGNQEENNDCSTKLKAGQVSFNAETMGRYESPNEDWYSALWYRRYKLCLMFDDNEPYTQFTCSSETFRIVRPEVN